MSDTRAALEAKARITAEQAQARAEDIRWMAATGEDLAGVARRLDITIKALEKFCERNHLEREMATLRRNSVGHVRQGRIRMVLA